MNDKNKSARRRLLLGLGTSTALSVWHKPVINSVIMPAHAQTSEGPPPDPMTVCPMILFSNVVFGPVSGSTTPPVCNATFDVLSSDSLNNLQIVSITTSALPANVSVDIQDIGTATASSGPRIVWSGPATDAPFCNDLMPTEEVTFTITATCDAASGATFSQDFNLSGILEP